MSWISAVSYSKSETDLVGQYIAPDFVEHCPRVQVRPRGPDRFIKSLPPSTSDEIGPQMTNPPAYILAEGDLVTFVFQTADAAKGRNQELPGFSFLTCFV